MRVYLACKGKHITKKTRKLHSFTRKIFMVWIDVTIKKCSCRYFRPAGNCSFSTSGGGGGGGGGVGRASTKSA